MIQVNGKWILCDAGGRTSPQLQKRQAEGRFKQLTLFCDYSGEFPGYGSRRLSSVMRKTGLRM
jgi:hypothetical protein